MKEVVIKSIERIDNKINKNGNPYQRVYIYTEGRPDTKLSGFGNAYTDTWKAGDTVLIEIEKVGEYWNFKTPEDRKKVTETFKKNVVELVTAPNEMDLFRAQLHELNFRLGAVEQLVRDFAKTGAEKVFAEMEAESPYQDPKF